MSTRKYPHLDWRTWATIAALSPTPHSSAFPNLLQLLGPPPFKTVLDLSLKLLLLGPDLLQPGLFRLGFAKFFIKLAIRFEILLVFSVPFFVSCLTPFIVFLMKKFAELFPNVGSILFGQI